MKTTKISKWLSVFLCATSYTIESLYNKEATCVHPSESIPWGVPRKPISRHWWYWLAASPLQPLAQYFTEVFFRVFGLVLKRRNHDCVGECNVFSQRTERFETLSLRDPLLQVKYSVLKLLLWLVHMQFPIKDKYIHMSKERKWQKQLWDRMNKCRIMSKNLISYHKVKTQSEQNETLWTQGKTWKSLQWRDFSKQVPYQNLIR